MLCSRRYVNGIPLGPGMCVVDEGGSIIPVSKCTVKELRAEAEARSILGFKEMKRPELSTAIKVGPGCLCGCVAVCLCR
jgi:hypothetical protein